MSENFVQDAFEKIVNYEKEIRETLASVEPKLRALESGDDYLSGNKQAQDLHLQMTSLVKKINMELDKMKVKDTKQLEANNATLKHIQQVQRIMTVFIQDLMDRMLLHDQSKLHSPESETFAKYTAKLKGSTYGSDEYKQFLSEMKPALDHHYANNSHHPEYYENGMEDMTLLDLLKLLCDWKAATMRHDDGDIVESLKINAKRFNMSSTMVNILRNTIVAFGLDKTPAGLDSLHPAQL